MEGDLSLRYSTLSTHLDIVCCISYRRADKFYVCIIVSDGSLVKKELVVNKTAHVVTGLTPGVSYTFSVTAENAVSYQDNNINLRSVNVTATTLKGGK